MNSPIEIRLFKSIDETKDDLSARAFFRTELACYWARVGEFDAAEHAKTEIRGEFGDGRNARVSILLICLDALLLHYKNLNPKSRDRMCGAYLLSKSLQDRELIARTAAWMAYLDFNQSRFEQMGEALATCFKNLDKENREAVCRVSLLLADVCLLADEPSASRWWYDRAHTAAVDLGDHAAISALTYNRPALKLFLARLRKINGTLAGQDLQLIRGEVRSAVAYQHVAQILSLDGLLTAAEIGVAMLQEDYSSAETKIHSLLESSDIDHLNDGQRLLLQVDLAVLLARTGRMEKALEQVHSIDPSSINGHSDDVVIVAANLSEAAEICGDQALREVWTRIKDVALLDHANLVARLKSEASPYTRPESTNSFRL